MATPDQMQWDPNRTALNAPASQHSYIKVGEQILMVNNDSNIVVPMEDNPYPGTPIKLPPELMAVDQPYIRTCGRPSPTSKGCLCAEGGGCPILPKYGRVGEVNLIVEKNGKADSIACHMAYTGVSAQGRPTTQGAMLSKGWRILTDRTTIPENVYDVETKMLRVRQTEVPNLAPFYEEWKVGRFSDPPVEAPKRGRKHGSKNKPKVKDANREEVASTGS